MKVIVAGGGLAGCEASLQLAKAGFEVDLYEMRPCKMTGAHKTENLAELVCSNSLGSCDATNASGLLKNEMEVLGGFLIKIAKECQVPAGNALAIDRILFANKVQELVENNNKINLIREELTEIPEDVPVILATGPLTSPDLVQKIVDFTDEDNLFFFDAIAPIVEKDSINFDVAFYQNRYDKGDACYINCPMNKEQYEKFYSFLINAEKIELKDFEKNAKFFESCLPVEVLASRDINALRFGPMKPVGIKDVRTNQENYAIVQLRQDNKSASLYNLVGFQTNLKWGEQKELLKLIPGLENVNIVRYGVMHRNTFINAPKVLKPTLQSKKRENLFFAGQLSGVEGYSESIATGLLAGLNMAKFLNQQPLLELPQETMLGALTHYISFFEHKHFQPINSNWGIVAECEMDRKIKKDKKLKTKMLSDRAISSLNSYLEK